MKLFRNLRAVWRAIVELPRLVQDVKTQLENLRDAELRLAKAIKVRMDVQLEQPGDDRLQVRVEIARSELHYAAMMNLWDHIGYRMARDMEMKYREVTRAMRRGPGSGRLP